MMTEHERDALLREVSRSFYLTLRWLPREVRKSLSCAYLLARASDSVADAEGAAVDRRRAILEKMNTEPCGKEDFLPLREFVSRGEWSLLCAFPRLLQEVKKSEDFSEISEVWRKILSGQTFDLVRWGGKDVLPCSKEERDRYTYLVAGCVGEFWTRLCAQRIPHFSREGLPSLLKKADAFGRGLQLVNILRDRVHDARDGRIYLLEEEVSDGLREARLLLNEGRKYVGAVRHRRLRAVCLLPLVLAEETLKLVEAHPEKENLKISRKEVRRGIWLSILVWISPKISFWMLEKERFSSD